jgi:multidrug efflux pump
VIFLFLRSLAGTVIPAIAVPLSLVGTFGVMYLLGFSLNNLTLMALTIATGFVVDDAIVMIENVARYVEQGMAGARSRARGAQQIGFTILSLTVSLVAVLIPLLFMGDVVGRLFREFAITLGVTILISAVVSLTLDADDVCAAPPPHARGAAGPLLPRVRAVLERTIDGYGARSAGCSTTSARRSSSASACSRSRSSSTSSCRRASSRAGHGRDPRHLEAPQSISFPADGRAPAGARARHPARPGVESVSSFIGIDGTNVTLNSGRILVNLKPLDERDGSATDVIRRLEPKLAAVDGIHLYLQPVQDLTVAARVSRTQYQYTLEDADAAELAREAPRVLHALRRGPSCTTWAASSRTTACRPRSRSTARRPSRLGITPQLVDDTLYDAFGQRQISTIFTQLNQYRVVLEVAPEFQQAPARPRRRLRGGRETAIASRWPRSRGTTEGRAPLVVSHQGSFPSSTLSFEAAHRRVARQGGRRRRGDDTLARAARQHLRTAFRAPRRRSAPRSRNEVFLILAALVTVYIVWASSTRATSIP